MKWLEENWEFALGMLMAVGMFFVLGLLAFENWQASQMVTVHI